MATKEVVRPEKVWVFDGNRRVYPKNGRGGPIWREHWQRLFVVGETRQSWLCWYSADPHNREKLIRVPKKGGRGIAFSEAEIDMQEWIHNHRHKISARADRVDDYDTLKKIASLVGYFDD